MTTAKKCQAILVVTMTALILNLVPVKITLGQSKSDFEASAEGLRTYYHDPVKSDGSVYTVYGSKVDMDNVSDEELGVAFLGGLILSYSEADKKDNIGVIVINTLNEAIAMTMERSALQKYSKGKITIDELLAQTEKFSIDLKDFPEIDTNLANFR